MLSIGISISKERWCAVALSGTSVSPTVMAAVSAPCGEPYGGPDTASTIASALRESLPGKPIPGVVVTLPSPLAYLRTLTLPVSDLPRARVIHLSELDGNLPIEDDEILSDLFPASPRTPDTFLAVATRRSFVEIVVSRLAEAGMRADRIITDHASALLVGADRGTPDEAVLVATLPDILLMRLSGGGVLSARQFPAAMAESPGEILSALGELSEDDGNGIVPAVFLGVPPPPLAGFAPAASISLGPEGLPPSHLAAYGAALAPFLPDVAGGFSFRTSAEAAASAEKEVRIRRFAAISLATALVLSIGALEFAKWVEGEKANRTRAQVVKEFAEAAPDVRSVVQATAQIREKVASLRRRQKELGADAPAPAELLMQASRSLPQGEISLREVSIEGGRLRLAGEAGEAKFVEAYRSGLAGTFGPSWAVTVQESEGGAKGPSVRYTILVEKKA
ncbi:MAG: hypothetical protein C4529_05370 [Deltaproteobacteria bacterium]|nr:MAG: hypothetical protein C4529_05370 [Deltaproteobacteria bacterium]